MFIVLYTAKYKVKQLEYRKVSTQRLKHSFYGCLGVLSFSGLSKAVLSLLDLGP